MTFKTFKQIVDNNDVSLLRERIFEISKEGWHNITIEMEFTIDELREFADKIDWHTYVKRLDWVGKKNHIEFADRNEDLKIFKNLYKRGKQK